MMEIDAFVIALEVDLAAAGAIVAFVALRVLGVRTLIATSVLRTRARFGVGPAL